MNLLVGIKELGLEIIFCCTLVFIIFVLSYFG